MLAAIHSLAEWVYGNPVPAPDYMTCHHTITAVHEPDLAKRRAAVRDFAATYGLEMNESDRWWWATMNLADHHRHGLVIVYTLFADKQR